MFMRSLFLVAVALLGISVRQDADAALSTDPFVADSAFYNGNAIEDRFAGGVNATFKAQKLVKLGNGDVVVAGLVPAGFQPDQANGYFNIGLVRYGANGGRVPWPNLTAAYNYWNNMYIAYPNSTGSQYTSVRDIKAMDGFIYVLADYQYGTTDSDVRILSFTEGGQFVAMFAAFEADSSEYGAGLAPYSYLCGTSPIRWCSRIVAVATYATPTGRAMIRAKRLSVGMNLGFPTGVLSVDNSFGPNNNGTNDFPAPDVSCQAGSLCSARADSVAATGTNTSTPRIYVAAETLWQNQNRNPAALGIDGNSGNALAGFGNTTGGFFVQRFTIGGDSNDQTRGIAVSGTGSSDDRIYVLSEMAMNCGSGVGILSLDSTGHFSSWGNFSAGWIVFGGNNNSGVCATSINTIPRSIALNGDRLAIAGWERSPGVLPTYITDPLLAIVRASDGTVLENRSARPSHAAGANYVSGGGWNDVVADGANRFVTTGPLYDSLGSKPLFGTARFVSDRIFGSGFENP